MKSECPPDEDLLALAMNEECNDDLRAHVEQCPDCRGRVQLLAGEVNELRSLSGTFVDSSNRRISEPNATETLPAGTVIGRYCIVGNLGSGGQADVYRVVDSELERFLVLKLSRR